MIDGTVKAAGPQLPAEYDEVTVAGVAIRSYTLTADQLTHVLEAPNTINLYLSALRAADPKQDPHVLALFKPDGSLFHRELYRDISTEHNP